MVALGQGGTGGRIGVETTEYPRKGKNMHKNLEVRELDLFQKHHGYSLSWKKGS